MDAIAYRPYQWIGEDQDAHVLTYRQFETAKEKRRQELTIEQMGVWARNNIVTDEMGIFVRCKCGSMMKATCITDTWVMEHYAH